MVNPPVVARIIVWSVKFATVESASILSPSDVIVSNVLVTVIGKLTER